LTATEANHCVAAKISRLCVVLIQQQSNVTLTVDGGCKVSESRRSSVEQSDGLSADSGDNEVTTSQAGTEQTTLSRERKA